MKKTIIIPLIIQTCLIVIFLLRLVSSSTPGNINICQTLDTAGTYTLTQNVNSSGTCFIIATNNIILNGQGYLINYSSSATGYGIKKTEFIKILVIENLKEYKYEKR